MAEQWDQCWSAARFHLRLTDADFFALTPRQLRLLLDRHREAVRHGELLAGIVASTVANFSFGAPGEPLAPARFMPTEWLRRRPRAPRVDRRRIAGQVGVFLRARMGVEY